MNSENNNHGKANGGKMASGTASGKPIDAKTADAISSTLRPVEAIVREGSPQPAVHSPAPLHLHPLNAEMRTRWASFVDADLKDVKTREDLSAAIVAKYGITADVAAAQVKDWAVGRSF